MITVEMLKDRLLEHLNKADFNKMSTGEISGYVDILKKVKEIEEPSMLDAMRGIVCNGYNSYNPPSMPTKGE